MKSVAPSPSVVAREAERAMIAVQRFDRLRRMASDPSASEELRRRLEEEAQSVLDEVGPVRLSVARRIVGVSDSTLRERIREGALKVVGQQRPARIRLADVVEARDELAAEGPSSSDPGSRPRAGWPSARLDDWVRRGLLRGEVRDDGTVALDDHERWYVDSHAEVLRALVEVADDNALPLAVLFGSVARGDDHPRSDVDLLVQVPDGADGRTLSVAIEVKARLGRPVEALTLDALSDQPGLVAAILAEGRVLRDATGTWQRLREQRGHVEVDAERAHKQLLGHARAAIDELKAAV